MKLEELLNNRSVTISVTLEELKEFAEYIISNTGSVNFNNRMKENLLNKTIEELELSVRAYNCFKYAGIETVKDLIQCTEKDLRNIRHMGAATIQEIKEKLRDYGLYLGIRLTEINE